MQKVSSLVSKDIGNYLTNRQTWGGIIYNVKSYGAKGDGTTDDTAAISTALSTIPTSAILFFPDGTYNISTSVTAAKSVSIVMSKGAKLFSTNSAAAASTSGVLNISSSDVTLLNVTIDVNNKDMRGIFSDETDNLSLENVKVLNSGMSGIWIDSSDNVSIRDIYTSNCSNSDDGDNLAGSVRFNHCNFISVNSLVIEDAQGKGLAFEDCTDFSVDNVFVERTFNLQPGIYFNNCEKGMISHVSVIDGDMNCIKYSRGCSYIVVSDSIFVSRAQTTDEDAANYVCIIQGASYCELLNSKLISKSSVNALRIEDHPDPEGANTNYIRVDGNIFDVRGVTEGATNPLCVEMRKRSDTAYLTHDITITNNQMYGGLQGLRSTDIPYLTVEGNIFDEHSSTVIQVTASTTKNNVKVNGNIIKNALGSAITFFTIEDFDCNQNDISASASIGASISGISVGTNTKRGNVNHNRIKGFTGNLITATQSTVDTINIQGNIGVGGTGAVRGVDFRGNNARIVNNQFSNTTLNVFVQSTSTGIHLSGNTPSKKATSTTSGDGAATTVIIPHTLGVTPSYFVVTKASVGIADIDAVTADATNLTVTFVAALASGTNNVVLKWEAEV